MKTSSEAGVDDDHGFATTAVMESASAEVNERDQVVDRHLTELVVSGSPAQAIRDRFAATRADLETATSMITLVDPDRVWAASVIKALSDAGGRPVERLQLRDRAGDEPLATIERTTLARRQQDTLRVFHADVRASGPDGDEISTALMERSHLSVVIIGPMEPPAIDALLGALAEATRSEGWRCPHLMFLLPPGAAWLAQKVEATDWSERLRVHVSSEPMTGASAVWNAIVECWDQVRLQPVWTDAPDGVAFAVDAVSESATQRIAAAESPHERTSTFGSLVGRTGRDAFDPTRGQAALAALLRLEGLLACAIAEIATGIVQARELPVGSDVDLDLAASACAQALQATQMRSRNMGLADPIDELILTAGAHHMLIRTLPRHPDVFVLALLEKQGSNLALARLQVLDVERGLA